LSTPKSDIFDKFLTLIQDRNLCLNYSDETRNNLLNSYLIKATSIHFKECRKDLTLEQKPEYESNELVYSSEAMIELDSIPDAYDNDAIETFCKIGDDSLDYSFDYNTLEFTLNESVSDGDVITYGYIYSGEFEEDLSYEEQFILAYGMIISWVSFNLYVTDKMRDTILSKDFSQPHSPANLIKELRLLKTDAIVDLRNAVVDYTEQSIDFDGYK